MPRPGICRMLKPHQPIMGISAATPRHSFRQSADTLEG